ncbi:MAG: PEP-CTERM sorting domain-containing protein [Verrucomicrobia bacterium]|nr:PEP-CTERM sorting domain-containing protein [Verrucomicrobiota bacterium]
MINWRILMLALPLLWSAKDCSGLMIVAGQSYTYSFTSIGPGSTDSGDNQDTWAITLAAPNIFDGPDLFQYECFGTSSLSDPFYSESFNADFFWPSGGSINAAMEYPVRTPRWADGDGAIRLTTTEGAINFTQISVGYAYGGVSKSNTITPVPEPSTSALLTLALGALAARRRR